MTVPQKKIVEVSIESLSSEGRGLGVYTLPNKEKRKAEVAFTLPGEKALALLLGKRSGVRQTLLEEIIEASPLRQQHRCPHFAKCGGCQLQHMSYEEQLRWKQQKVEGLFGSKALPILACPSQFWYRNKMEFTFSENGAGAKFLGLILHNSRGRVIDLSVCYLVNPWFVAVLKQVKTWWEESGLQAYNAHKNSGTLRTLILREGKRTGELMALLTISPLLDGGLKKRHLDSFVEAVQKGVDEAAPLCSLGVVLRIQQTLKGRPTQFYQMLLKGPDTIHEVLEVGGGAYTFSISPTGFFQPNSEQAEVLFAKALSLAPLDENSVFLDLYCGCGTMGVLASARVKKVVGIEICRESVIDANENIRANRVGNMEVLQGDVGAVLEGLREKGELTGSLTVSVDPPRSGLSPQAIKTLLELRPKHIIYISCNPKTQSENVAAFCQNGYALTAIQPVDQFPQTIHVENIIILSLP